MEVMDKSDYTLASVVVCRWVDNVIILVLVRSRRSRVYVLKTQVQVYVIDVRGADALVTVSVVHWLLVTQASVAKLPLVEVGALCLGLEHRLVPLVEGGVHLLVVGHYHFVLISIAAKQVSLDLHAWPTIVVIRTKDVLLILVVLRNHKHVVLLVLVLHHGHSDG